MVAVEVHCAEPHPCRQQCQGGGMGAAGEHELDTVRQQGQGARHQVPHHRVRLHPGHHHHHRAAQGDTSHGLHQQQPRQLLGVHAVAAAGEAPHGLDHAVAQGGQLTGQLAHQDERHCLGVALRRRSHVCHRLHARGGAGGRAGCRRGAEQRARGHGGSRAEEGTPPRAFRALPGPCVEAFALPEVLHAGGVPLQVVNNRRRKSRLARANLSL
mmetsp:Transcript_39592/g.86259  ORF Transcript_39592/g.86259 Transcript_39592/m.86259 type:complete len:213 (-) Transcript_39592:2034-2672(-)